MAQNIQDLIFNLTNFDKSLKTIEKKFSFGTSGFRYEAGLLDKVSFRVALGLYLKSLEYNGLPFGLMITASHNKYKDNGLKIAALKGESAPSSWEGFFEDLANTNNIQGKLKEVLEEISKEKKISVESLLAIKANICIGYDTRPSSINLEKIVKNTFEICNCNFISYGIITTPGLHYLTLQNQIIFNKQISENSLNLSLNFCGENLYWDFLKKSNEILGNYFKESIKIFHKNNQNEYKDNYEYNILFDCCNGISAFLKEKIFNIFDTNKDLNISFCNTDYENYQLLNEGCGSEFIQKEKILPKNYKNILPDIKNANNTLEYVKNVSFDGDVDRIIYFHSNKENNLKIIDGDYLTCLFAAFLKKIFENLTENLQKEFFNSLSLGIISTAYSNGSFMEFIEKQISYFDLKLAKTGVKNLHKKAIEYDIGIYFEPNGHGTIHHSEKILQKINSLKNSSLEKNDKFLLSLLEDFLLSFNQTVGDSINIAISAEHCLKFLNFRILDVFNFYEIIPSVNLKKIVKDKNIYLSNEDDSKLLAPLEIQNKIDDIVSEFKSNRGRCFVRASGTEDIVRIYSEAESEEIAKIIAEKVYEILA